MFKFGFSSSQECEDVDEESSEKGTSWLNCEEVIPTNVKETENITNTSKIIPVIIGRYQIKYLSPDDVVLYLRSTVGKKNVTVLDADQCNSDLVTASYEGGHKIWECTYDLINFISNDAVDLNGKHVLDLGCGCGIVGILCVLGGSSCYFQDYNKEVIEYITIPNLRLNAHDKIEKCKFFSGDWQSFCDVLGDLPDDLKFDYIFTSETIYNTENYTKLLDVFQKYLKKNGTIYLAAKSYYFGVGGGINLFIDYIKDFGVFDCHTCWECTEGVKRAILKITFKI